MTGSAGGTVVVPVSVDNAKGIAGGDMTLSYDANLLTAKQVQGSDLLTKAGITVVPNLSTAGKVQVSMAGVSGIASGSGVLLNVTFEIQAGAATGSTPVGLEALLADELGTALATTTVAGAVTIGGGLVGDVNGDQRVNSADAILVLRFSAGLSTPTEAQKRAGDVNGDGKTNSGDAILILRTSAGLLTQFPRSGKVVAGPTNLLRLVALERNGDELVVPVELGVGAAGADLELLCDGAALRVEQVDGPPAVLLASLVTGPGVLRVSVAHAEAWEPVVLRLQLVGPGEAPAVYLRGQVFGVEGDALGSVAGGLAQPAVDLLGCYPNPFDASTTLRYSLAEAGDVQLVIYDVSGAAVRRLVSGWQPAGGHSVAWDGRNEAGQSMASGSYLGCLQTGRARQVHKLTLLK